MDSFSNHFHLFDFIRLLGGIAMFVLAVRMMEDSIRLLAGRSFKLFLQRITLNKWQALIVSALLTGILQGSSVIMVIVLALVGAGVIPLRNAMAVVLGANLGSSIDSWLVAALGFKISLDILAYPAVIVAAWLTIRRKTEKHIHVSGLFFGFALLLLAIGLMKVSVAEQLPLVNKEWLSTIPFWQFAIAGMLITAVIQSSLATMVLALSALDSGMIGFYTAASIVIGAEVGTTLKLFVGAAGRQAVKKQLALTNFIINFVTSMIAIVFVVPLAGFIEWIFGMEDPLFALVGFQTMMNFISLLIFFPFLDRFSTFIEKQFVAGRQSITLFISSENEFGLESTFELYRKEVLHFLRLCCAVNMAAFGIRAERLISEPGIADVENRRELFRLSDAARYAFIKELQGELQLYYLKLRRASLQDDQIESLEHWIASVRSAMHAVKCVHDISQDIENLFRSSKELKYKSYNEVRDDMKQVYDVLFSMLNETETPAFSALQELYERINHDYSSMLRQIYEGASAASIGSNDFTTIMNLNRELYSSNHAMVMSMKDLLLDSDEADRFADLAVYQA